MARTAKPAVRVWGGVGLIALGLAIALLTYITVMGPIFGLILVGIGVFLIGWTVRSQVPHPPPPAQGRAEPPPGGDARKR